MNLPKCRVYLLTIKYYTTDYRLSCPKFRSDGPKCRIGTTTDTHWNPFNELEIHKIIKFDALLSSSSVSTYIQNPLIQ